MTSNNIIRHSQQNSHATYHMYGLHVDYMHMPGDLDCDGQGALETLERARELFNAQTGKFAGKTAEQASCKIETL